MPSIIAGPQGLDNSVIGGPNYQRNAIRFQAKYSSPLAAMRCYVIDNEKGYSAGTGGVLSATLETESEEMPSGNVLALGKKVADQTYADPSSGRGRFPLVCFGPEVELTAGEWYWVLITNADPRPDLNYFSINNFLNNEKQNQVPTMQVWQQAHLGLWMLVPELIPSPLVLHYANGLFQGLGWIGITDEKTPPTLEAGTAYGFPAGSCV